MFIWVLCFVLLKWLKWKHFIVKKYVFDYEGMY